MKRPGPRQCFLIFLSSFFRRSRLRRRIRRRTKGKQVGPDWLERRCGGASWLDCHVMISTFLTSASTSTTTHPRFRVDGFSSVQWLPFLVFSISGTNCGLLAFACSSGCIQQGPDERVNGSKEDKDPCDVLGQTDQSSTGVAFQFVVWPFCFRALFINFATECVDEG